MKEEEGAAFNTIETLDVKMIIGNTARPL